MNQQKTHEFAPIPLEIEKIGKACLDAAFKVHTVLGPGLLESTYETALAYELTKRNISLETQILIPINYDGHQLNSGFRCDLLVEKSVIIELKAVEKMIPLYEAQLLTYLKLSGVRLGYLINFNIPHLKTGIKRMVY
ncbi:GxxExxY protein [Patescibacteria group bacterium]|nr:GxxExxY protein [Patescibacteria group bacterium]